jgi:hypothetical protein
LLLWIVPEYWQFSYYRLAALFFSVDIFSPAPKELCTDATQKDMVVYTLENNSTNTGVKIGR